MRLVLSPAAPGPDACRRWISAPSTSDTEGLRTGGHDVYEARVQVRPDEDADAAYDRVRARIFAYDIFPPDLLRFVVCPKPRIEEGTVIVQRVGVGPIRVESAVRVIKVWDTDGEERTAGFEYVTLAGHPERGNASFAVQCDRSGAVKVVLKARSEAGTILTRLGRPVARRIQVGATRAALARLTGAA